MYPGDSRLDGQADERGRSSSDHGSPRPEVSRAGGGSVSGFTLIEVLAAFVIFSIGVLGVAQTAVLLSLQTEVLGSKSEVVLLSGQFMDSLRLEDMSTVEAGTSVDTVVAGGRSYLLTVSVTDSGSRLREIQVRSELLDGSGEPMIFASYISAPEETTTDETWETW